MGQRYDSRYGVKLLFTDGSKARYKKQHLQLDSKHLLHSRNSVGEVIVRGENRLGQVPNSQQHMRGHLCEVK